MREAPIIWCEVHQAVASVVESYNATDTGKLHRANIRTDARNDRSFTVESDRGAAPDCFNQVVIIISMTWDGSTWNLIAKTEKWLTRAGTFYKTLRQRLYEFQMKVNAEMDQVELSRDGASVTPLEAAEVILSESLSESF